LLSMVMVIDASSVSAKTADPITSSNANEMMTCLGMYLLLSLFTVALNINKDGASINTKIGHPSESIIEVI